VSWGLGVGFWGWLGVDLSLWGFGGSRSRRVKGELCSYEGH
jgi:hypothetical protein